jgi:hypothetical protein
MFSDKCDTIEIGRPALRCCRSLHKRRRRLRQIGPGNSRPERRIAPGNVTKYVDPAAHSPDFEYWVSAWSEPPDVIHEKPAIEEAIDRMKREKFACAGSQSDYTHQNARFDQQAQ